MATRVTDIITRPNTSIDFNSWPNNTVKDLIMSNYVSPLENFQSEKVEYSVDNLTKTVTTEYASLDDFIIQDQEGSDRDEIWQQVQSHRKSLGIIKSQIIIDTDTNAAISNDLIQTKIAELKASGRIPN